MPSTLGAAAEGCNGADELARRPGPVGVALRLFDDDLLPGLSHTICPDCEQRVERLLD